MCTERQRPLDDEASRDRYPMFAGRFDQQAPLYDVRAGFPPHVPRAIADAFRAVMPDIGDGLVIEVGAGTGLIGSSLADAGVRYLGVDSSRPMLEEFLRKLRETGRSAALLRCDCERPWPVRDRAATAVIASRVLHLLDRRHLIAEITRVCRPQGYVLVGRVDRDPEALKSRLRRERRRLLRHAGIEPRDGTGRTRRFFDELVRRGAVPLGRYTVSEWRGSTTARRMIADWEQVPSIGGVAVPDDVRMRVLEALRSWAGQEPGGLDREEPFTERYIIEAVRLP